MIRVEEVSMLQQIFESQLNRTNTEAIEGFAEITTLFESTHLYESNTTAPIEVKIKNAVVKMVLAIEKFVRNMMIYIQSESEKRRLHKKIEDLRKIAMEKKAKGETHITVKGNVFQAKAILDIASKDLTGQIKALHKSKLSDSGLSQAEERFTKSYEDYEKKITNLIEEEKTVTIDFFLQYLTQFDKRGTLFDKLMEDIKEIKQAALEMEFESKKHEKMGVEYIADRNEEVSKFRKKNNILRKLIHRIGNFFRRWIAKIAVFICII